MKILSKQDAVIFFSIDPYYFEKHEEMDRRYNTQSWWRRAEKDTYILIHGISYKVWDRASGDQFIKYERRLKLHCIIEDISEDKVDILKIKEEMHIASSEFMEQNSFSFFERLRFPVIDFSERLEREKESFLVMTEQQEPYESKSETQKEVERLSERSKFSVGIDVD
ncbi:hypothetical protein IM792_12125 [Mucilaginibacter sp. JRF]|uniref:hypothetical protein n=1 Tax=Mucilaginibacter sp. JRF TaxID=2780088 RepID=UPI001882C72B|nr:hypothetical protein [Mucilaginibacter sp. JRF]MBE9585198.1 hypothetical protein [Mucilaginibacter sp. JRF]